MNKPSGFTVIDPLDLLQKSFEFRIVEGSDQIEMQTKALMPIAIALTQDMKDLYLTNNILDRIRVPNLFHPATIAHPPTPSRRSIR